MDIPYYSLAIVYLIVLLVYALALGFNLYHMVRWGLFNFTGKLNTFMVLGVMVCIIIFTGILLINVDWLSTFSPLQLTPNELNFSL